MIGRILASAALCVAFGSQGVLATPWLPERDDEVLERLPTSADPRLRELRALQRDHTDAPHNLAIAVRLARAAIEAGRAESDPRYFGWAEGAIAAWTPLSAPPLDVLLLRATLRQNRHDFAGALADLAQLLARDPRNAQAWLTSAVIHQVQGHFAVARQDCIPLLRLAPPLVATTCLTSVESLSGRGARSFVLLTRAIEKAADADPVERAYALASSAEMAVRLGRTSDAERLFAAGLALAPRDAQLLAARADFLLDAGRAEEVVALLSEETRVDGLLLRLALAEQRLAAPALAAHCADLRARYAASRMREDALHQGEEARAALELFGDADEALRLARANFALQREPRDLRVLLEAALATGDARAAEPALRLIRESALEDVRLAPLVARLEAP